MAIDQTGSVTRTGIIVVLAVCLVLAVAVMLLPKGFSDDLSVIGRGLPVVVLTHDKGSVKSMELMTLMNRLRPDYAGRVEFLAVELDSPTGQAFSAQQGVGGATLSLFDAAGVRRAVLDRSVEAETLRSALDAL